MIIFVLIAMLSMLIFLAFSDAVQVAAQRTAEWERARRYSKKHLAR